MNISLNKILAAGLLAWAVAAAAPYWDYIPAADISVKNSPATPGPVGLVPLVRFSIDPVPAEGVEAREQATLEKNIVAAFNRHFPTWPLRQIPGEAFLKAGFNPEKLLSLTASAGMANREFLDSIPETRWGDQPATLEAVAQIKILGQTQQCRYLLLMHDPHINFLDPKKPKDPSVYGSGTDDHIEKGGEITYQLWDAEKGVLLVDDGLFIKGSDLKVLLTKMAEDFCSRISKFIAKSPKK